MEEVHIESYKKATVIYQMAVFEWDMIEDTLIYDEMMYHLIQHKIPKQNVGLHLNQARLIHPKDRLNFKNHIRRMQEKTQRSAPWQDFDFDFRIYTTNRCYIWIYMNCRVQYRDGVPYHATGFIQNVDVERQELNRMQNVIEHDPMTGLYNKTHSAYLVNQAISITDRINALLVIDLDNFKAVNDKLGHLIGDAVIMDMAMNLKTTFRNTDILGHIGGDEFMVLMKDIPSPDIVYQKCGQIRNMLRKTYTHKDENVPVSASIGIALSPEHGKDYKTLFSHADAALYQSKKLGKDMQVLYQKGFKDQREKDEEQRDTSSQNFNQMLSKPMEYIFGMIFNSQNTSLSVQLLLEIFAKHFNVHRAYVFWHVEGQYWPRILFDYVKDDFKKTSLAHDAPIRRQIRKNYQHTDYGRFSECEDTSKLPTTAKNEFERRQICAYIECAVMEGDDFIGGVGFDDCRIPHTWTKSEHEVLRAFAEIMRRFLFGQIYFERTRKNGRWSF